MNRYTVWITCVLAQVVLTAVWLLVAPRDDLVIKATFLTVVLLLGIFAIAVVKIPKLRQRLNIK